MRLKKMKNILVKLSRCDLFFLRSLLYNNEVNQIMVILYGSFKWEKNINNWLSK